MKSVCTSNCGEPTPHFQEYINPFQTRTRNSLVIYIGNNEYKNCKQ